MKFRYLLFLVLVLAFCVSACSKVPLLPDPPEPKPHEGVDKELKAVILSAGENGKQLRAFIDAFEPNSPRKDAAETLVKGMTLGEAAGLGAKDLIEHVDLAFAAREAMPWGNKIPDDIFVKYVISPRVDREPLTGWRMPIAESLAPRIEGLNCAQSVEEIRRWVGEFAAVGQGGGYFLPPIPVLKRGEGTREEMAVVYVCALRSMCIPARTHKTGSGTFDYWMDGKWITADVTGLHEDPKTKSKREIRLRSFKGEALAWCAAQRKMPINRELAMDVLVRARGNWKEVVNFIGRPKLWRAKAFEEYLKGLSDSELVYMNAQDAYESVQSSIAIVEASPKRVQEWKWFTANILPEAIPGTPLEQWRVTYDMKFVHFRQLPVDKRIEAALGWLQSLRVDRKLPQPYPLTPLQILTSETVHSDRDMETARIAIQKVLGLYGRDDVK